MTSVFIPSAGILPALSPVKITSGISPVNSTGISGASVLTIPTEPTETVTTTITDDVTEKPQGDANGDGKVDYSDYDLLVEITTTNEKISDNIMHSRCDINEDGAVDSFDVVYLDLHLNNLKPIT